MEYSSNLLLVVSFSIFRTFSQLFRHFRNFFVILTIQRKTKTLHEMCDATNFRAQRIIGLGRAIPLLPRRALRFSIPIAAIKRDENRKIHDFPQFLLRLFYDPPNFFKKRDAPNRVPTTSRRNFQNSKEMRVLRCGKAHRDR